MMRSSLILAYVCFSAAAFGATMPCSIQHAAVAEPYVWLLCDRSELMVSADEGASWQRRQVPTDARLRAVAFLDSRRGFVAGDGGTLLATEDGAETWRQVPVPTHENLTSMHFAGEFGWVAGWTGVILHSADGGKTWLRQQSGVQQGLESIYFADSQHGWAVGWLGVILRTDDGGNTWERVKTPGALWSLNSVCFRDSKDGWAVGFAGQLLRSTDGGVTWKEQTSPVRAWLKSVAYDGAGRWWVASDDTILVSENGGESWTTIPVEGTFFIHQVLPLRTSVWAVGQFGVLKQTGNSLRLTALASPPETGWRSGSD
jgi:photosystem II stability/assembly factor-like uncharacterized protein